jgi:hypothetical protein
LRPPQVSIVEHEKPMRAKSYGMRPKDVSPPGY